MEAIPSLNALPQIVGALAVLSVALPARATAGTGNPTLTTGDAPDSICPSGWRLPGYSGDGSYYDLMMNIYHAQSSSNADSPILAVPLGFARPGLYLSSSPGYQTSTGYYWMSKRYSSSQGHFAYINSAALLPQTYYPYGHGFSVRCLAR